MNILRFVNSKDIREHLRNIGYEFNSLEAAWLIYQCRDAAIDEKHKAWNELIEKMPDCTVSERLNTVPQDSLHAFLRQYMELENKYLNEFYDEKHADTFDYNKPFVYKFKYIYKDGTEYEWDTVFSCFDALYESIMEPEDDVISIQCTKMQIDRLNSRKIAYFTPFFDFLRIDPGHIDGDKEMDVFWGVFDGLWFDFPTPFEKGDIVWDPNKPDGICAGPFVTTGICLDGIQNDKVKDNLRKNGDSSDMCAGGFFLNEDGSIYGECMSNYMDLEFYNKELTGSKRTLIALSNFLKDKIDPALFARAYHQIITAGDTENSIPLDYLKSGMILAGLSKPEHIKIWLDDVREAPEGYCHCHSVNEAKKKIIECEKEFIIIDEIDCDHDLGEYASDGGQLGDCKSLVKRLGIEKSVRFIGKRTDVPACLKLIDIYLFPSLFEGLPIALLEAQASGCFCAASDGVSTEVDRGLNSVRFISLEKNEAEWAKEIIENYNTWKEPEPKEILKKYIESGFEVAEAHKRLMRVYNGE